MSDLSEEDVESLFRKLYNPISPQDIKEAYERTGAYLLGKEYREEESYNFIYNRITHETWATAPVVFLYDKAKHPFQTTIKIVENKIKDDKVFYQTFKNNQKRIILIEGDYVLCKIYFCHRSITLADLHKKYHVDYIHGFTYGWNGNTPNVRSLSSKINYSLHNNILNIRALEKLVEYGYAEGQTAHAALLTGETQCQN